MKNCYFWATPSGPINLMKAEDMPVMPELSAWERLSPATQSDCQLKIKEYEAAIQAAKKSSVPIQDQERANDFLVRNGFVKVPDSIYGPFSNDEIIC